VFLPAWEHETRAATNVRASPERALEAVRETAVADVPLTALLLVLRSLPSLATGFAGRPWRVTGVPLRLRFPDEFAAFQEPGYAKVTMHFTAIA